MFFQNKKRKPKLNFEPLKKASHAVAPSSLLKIIEKR